MNFTTAGFLIRQSRRQAKLTQADLAKRLGMSRTTISQVETGVMSDLGIRKFAAICDLLGMEMTVAPRDPKLTLHEAYAKNREERQNAFHATDIALNQLQSTRTTHD